jgi:hypothetical protein
LTVATVAATVGAGPNETTMFRVFLLAGCAGCTEQWHAYDTIERPFEGPGTVIVRATASPEAWPRDVYETAVRASFSEDGFVDSNDPDHPVLGEVALVAPEIPVYQGGRDWVNVREAFADCARDDVCVHTYTYEVTCDEGCFGVFSVDAFIATMAPTDRPVDGLRLTFLGDEPDLGP